MMTAQDWVDHLDLQPHPEGGFYREIYRSPREIAPEGVSQQVDGSRRLATSIYFLLTHENFSAFHRLKSDEIWYFHAGSPLTVHVLGVEGTYRANRVGPGREATPQVVVPAGCWFGSTVDVEGGYALVGCAVAPGFDFRDFEMAQRHELLRAYPASSEIIHRLTRC